MFDPFTTFMVGSNIVSGLFSIYSSYKSSQATTKAERYRASLAHENAQRADILHLERAERARREGRLASSLFRMQVLQSGLSGASADMWIGQRTIAARLQEGSHLSDRDKTVSRFLKEEEWHKESEAGARSSFIWSALGTAAATGAKLAGHQYKTSKS